MAILNYALQTPIIQYFVLMTLNSSKSGAW